MLRSMTGFGEAHGLVDGVEFAVELRSVNNRYLKFSIRLPENLSSLEADLEALLRSRLSRGSVGLTVRMRVPDEKAGSRVNTAALLNYIEQLRPLEVDANPMLRIDLGSLLQLPGVCEPQTEELCRLVAVGLKKLVGKAVDKLLGMREREGKATETELLENCRLIEQNLAVVVARAPAVVREYHTRLTARVNELTNAGNLKIDEEVLAREVAIFAERSDVTEEITRLRVHVEQFRHIVASPEPAGRKLEFVAQEMLREANTIASKANDADIARAVVEIKTAVDRLKEQVQNVE